MYKQQGRNQDNDKEGDEKFFHKIPFCGESLDYKSYSQVFVCHKLTTH
jgi:hypothetical protein